MRTYLNLLPDSVRTRQTMRRLLGRWITVWILASCVGLAVVGYFQRDLELDRDRLRSMKSASRPLAEMSESAEKFKSELVLMEQNDALLRRLQDERLPITPLALVSGGASICNGRVWVRQMKFHATLPKIAGEVKTGEAAPEPTYHINLQGMAEDNLAVSDFVLALQQTQGFQSIELKSSLATQVDDKTVLLFLIESEL